MKIIILGAGVVGVTTAYFLARRGHEVIVVERQPGAAEECSYANGGQLSYSHVEPWATPGVLKKIPKWLLDPDSPLVLYPRLDLKMWKWMMSFLLHCNEKTARKNAAHMWRLAKYSQELMTELRDHTDLPFHFGDKGTLHVFSSQHALDGFAKQAAFQQGLGCEYEILSAQACVKKEPALAHSPQPLAGGVFFSIDETGDVHKFTRNLAEWLTKNYPVSFLYDTEVRRLEHEGDRVKGVVINRAHHTNAGITTTLSADRYIVSLGAYSPHVLRPLGVSVPIYPMKGYSITFPVERPECAPRVSITDQANKIVYSRLGDHIRVAGTAEFAGYNHEIRARRIATLKRMVSSLFPAAGDLDKATEWACLRPSTPDGSPILGHTRYRNLILNTGHGTLGWTLCAGSARVVADLVEDKTPAIDLAGFEMGR